ncbi:hypothetical protein [Streptomyces sp. NBC_01304]|uniref:hypothetical protein n=1 Tax=Streptomyces sp. NBC_01304 TaxID=2903818 RepID=UPI002E101248|nr:hypothetical protein OG430_33035 [Streptomyces sp. NBC_01304]
MHAPLPDPLAVLKLAAEKNISEGQAAAAIDWAARLTVEAWHEYADFWGKTRDDLTAMELWLALLGDDHVSLLDDAVSMILGAENVLEQMYRERDADHGDRQARVIRTNRPRIRIH